MRIRTLFAAMLLCLASPKADAGWFVRFEADRVNNSIQGQLVDFTHNHGRDRRIWSPALCEKRDLYVYLPPGYDPTKKYPVVVYLHGAFQDEYSFLRHIVRRVDAAIVAGNLSPLIIAAPDGSILGRPSLLHMASFYANSNEGRYEDYVMQDVWDFVMTNFPVRPEREAHALVGVSMGGSAAYTHAIKYKDKIHTVVGIMPALNLRWVDCHGNYRAPFDPDCWGWRSRLRPLEVIARPQGFTIRMGTLSRPLIGHGPEAMAKLAEFNPIEVMDRYNLAPGDLDLYVAYGGKDEFNINTQVESFLYRARERGVNVDVDYNPEGHHDIPTAIQFLPCALRWMEQRLGPYSPGR